MNLIGRIDRTAAAKSDSLKVRQGWTARGGETFNKLIFKITDPPPSAQHILTNTRYGDEHGL